MTTNPTARPAQLTAEEVRAMYAERRFVDLLRAKYDGRLDDYLAARPHASITDQEN